LNLDKQSQNLLCYHYTIPEWGVLWTPVRALQCSGNALGEKRTCDTGGRGFSGIGSVRLRGLSLWLLAGIVRIAFKWQYAVFLAAWKHAGEMVG
jgi:hypothetical protein